MRVGICGAGRWAMIIVKILAVILEEDDEIIMITKRDKDEMKNWKSKEGIGVGLTVSSNISRLENVHAVIIANAAADHYSCASKIIKMGIPVLVEKPVTRSVEGLRSLIKQDSKNVVPKLASALVYKHAKYMENSNIEHKSKSKVSRIYINWQDGCKERRGGIAKKYDYSIPIFVDVMPHLMSITSEFIDIQKRFKMVRLEVKNGGALVKIVYECEGVMITYRMERLAKARKRHITVLRDNSDRVCIDFAENPITVKEQRCGFVVGRSSRRIDSPLEKMLRGFLTGVKLGKWGDEFDNGISLKANIESKKLMKKYRHEQIKDMLCGSKRKASKRAIQIKYAMTEIAESNKLILSY
jgi:hypothetical protein